MRDTDAFIDIAVVLRSCGILLCSSYLGRYAVSPLVLGEVRGGR